MLLYIRYSSFWNRLEGCVQNGRCINGCYVLQPIGKKWLGVLPPKKTDEGQTAHHSKLIKFQDSAWKGTSYAILTIASAYALSSETFWMKTEEFWTDCEGALPCKYQPSFAVECAYAVQLAYYFYIVPSLLFFEAKKKDHWAMIVHHVATAVLVTYSYTLGWTKPGIVIMFLHDVCDPFMELAKLAKYAGREALTNGLFVLFMFVWIGMRMVYFPFWVNRSMLFECLGSVVGENSRPAVPHYEIITGLLLFLQVLHVYWTFLIVRIAYRAVLSGGTDDERESSDDD